MTINPNGNSTYAPADFRRALWKRWVALRNADLAQAEEIVVPALVLHVPAIGQGLDRAGGRRALLSWISALHAAFPAGRLAVEVGPIISKDLIAGRWVFTRHGDEGRAAADDVSFTGTDIIRVEGGRVVEFWVNHDVLGQAVPLGPVAV
ncbi:nuclear transport factor 2 family protein [Phytohabitans rumicis]|uniref:SnoaL-like domain-containing protein n=1 Tax=Phytohabitans rumicis TaxID=1076125 RepID=A0A6V8L3H4_9ACTN|nr:nuclear transport factor 2 family protein [Phytohabitans rumicis]GFJ91793.1 hypothetical protein Prum_054350 [Phytohabitans rumicis]